MKSRKTPTTLKQSRPDPWARDDKAPTSDPRGNAAVARELKPPKERGNSALQTAALQEKREDPSGLSGTLGLVEPIVSRREAQPGREATAGRGAPGGHEDVAGLVEPIVFRREALGEREDTAALLEPIVSRREALGERR